MIRFVVPLISRARKPYERLCKYLNRAKDSLAISSDKLYIRKDEFHKSLDTRTGALLRMSNTEQKEYVKDLVRRRNLAHDRDCGEW